ncbi:threonine/serine ThrE exporter family protein [Agromyces sp. SYSU T00194]|uniref:threonine/serine ThrE exporter family protein n=1 Tax=Agromyces chitinivorans TaxID=3158560 RepID=UPI00339630DD
MEARDAVDAATLRRFLLGIAEGLNAALESVDRVDETMRAIARAYGADDTDFVVLPTVILVQSEQDGTDRVALRTTRVTALRFDQIAALYDLVGRARRAAVDPAAGIDELNRIGAMRPRHPWFVRVLGHAILTTGLAMLLTPTWQGALVAFGLGAVLGLAKLVRSPTLALVFPVAAAFASATVVFLLAPHVAVGDPIVLLIAPLVTFLPGGVITTATMELAAGQMIAGASRLVTGLVQLALLAFGILAAGTMLGVGDASYVALEASVRFPWWTAVLGVLLIAVGDLLHFSAPGRTFGWVLLSLSVAYVGQVVGAGLAGPAVGGFLGALAMTPLVLWVSGLRIGAPAQLLFLPAFWLLVPGASGLAGLTEAIGTTEGVADFAQALISIMAIALGVLIGTAAHGAARRGVQQVANLYVEPAEPDADVDDRPTWLRWLPRRR